MNPTTLEIYIRYAQSANQPSESEVGMYHSRIAHDPDRCTAQRLRMNILDDNGIRCWDEPVGLGCTTPASRDGHHLCPCTSQELQPLCQSFLGQHAGSRRWRLNVILTPHWSRVGTHSSMVPWKSWNVKVSIKVFFSVVESGFEPSYKIKVIKSLSK